VRVVLSVTDPDVPVIVNVATPRVAVWLVVSVSVLLPVVGFGAKVAVTPLGRPVTARLTLPAKPYCPATKTVVVPELPWPMFTPFAESEKLGAWIVRGTVVLALTDPEVPVMVTLVCPSVAVLLAVSVMTLEPVVGFGTNVALTPLGKPVTARFTLPVNP
jgi:hypothetical protein